MEKKKNHSAQHLKDNISLEELILKAIEGYKGKCGMSDILGALELVKALTIKEFLYLKIK